MTIISDRRTQRDHGSRPADRPTVAPPSAACRPRLVFPPTDPRADGRQTMKFRFSDEDEALRREVRDFAEQELPADWEEHPAGEGYSDDRRHTAIGHRSPVDYERRRATAVAAA